MNLLTLLSNFTSLLGIQKANELLIYSAINRLYCDDATGEWFDTDLVLLQRQADFAGLPPNTSVAYTINGQPGDLYRCSSQGVKLLLSLYVYILLPMLK